MSALSVTRVPLETEIYEAQKGLMNQSIHSKIPVTLGNLLNPTLGGRTSGNVYVPTGKVEHPRVHIATSIAVCRNMVSVK